MVELQSGVALAPYTTLQVGGPAAHFATITTEKALDEVAAKAEELALPVVVLGGGSNVLVSDAGVDALVLHMAIANPTRLEVVGDEVLLTADAGMEFDALVAETVAAGLWGLENLSLIPGSVGATPIQNVGAYGVEVSDVIEQVRVYNLAARKFEVITAAECSFGYRDSYFKQTGGRDYVVVSVTFRLSRTPKPVLTYKDLQTQFSGVEPTQAAIREAVIAVRNKKFPNWREVGTAGSFFKNPVVRNETLEQLQQSYPELPFYVVDEEQVKLPLGWILDHVLKLKGKGSETVSQYEGQALVLINRGAATAADIVSHADAIAAQVEETTGIAIEWEVTKLGQF
jgi:UDP-N-acetylmuramate dehydrogenase